MEHKHSVYDSDTRFVIDPITRTIRNASSRKTTIIQYDHNSERFTFELPRYIEGHDMAECNKVEVHFFNIDSQTKEQKSGNPELTDLHIDPDDENIVVCSWLISQNSTQLKGLLKFLIRYKCVEDKVVNYAWNTAFFTGISVSEGGNADELFETEYVDVIEQWKESVLQRFSAEIEQWKNEAKADVDYTVEKWKEEAAASLSEWKKTESGEVHAVMGDYENYMNKMLDVERKRIDAFVALQDGSTTGDAELQDARIGIDGTVYGSVGTAIRQQFSKALNGQTTAFEYTISTSSTYALDMKIEKGVRYNIAVNFNDSVSNLDIGYTKEDGTDILLIDNAVSGQEYEFTPEYEGIRFRFWTYLKEDAAAYTNQIPISTDESGTLTGLMEGKRYNSSGLLKDSADGHCATGYIPVVGNSVVRFSGFDFNTGIDCADSSYIWFYDSNFTKVNGFAAAAADPGVDWQIQRDTTGNITQLTVPDGQNIAFLTVCAPTLSESAIVAIVESTVKGNVNVVGMVNRAAKIEGSIAGVETSLYGYKALVTKDSFTIAAGITLQAFYTIKPGRKFFVVFDSFNYDVVDRLNIYCNNADGNEIFHDSITPVIGELYECYTEKENANLILYLTPTETGGVVNFNITIYEENGIGERVIINERDIQELKEADSKLTESAKELYNKIGVPWFTEYSKTMSGVTGWDIEFTTEDDKQYIFKAESYSGQHFGEIQLYALNSMSDYKSIQSKVQIGDTVIFDGNSAYKYLRVYVVISQTEDQPETLKIKLGNYNGEALSIKVEELEANIETLEESVHKTKNAPNVLILGDSYSQMGYWVEQLKSLVSIGEVVNLGVSSASLKDKYTNRSTYPYNDRPVSNDTRGGNVNTFGSQVEKLKRLMLGEDLDSGESKVYENSTPDIILIEGGTNDPVDSSTEGYLSQIYTVREAYIARRSDTSPKSGYIKIPTPYEETNRTTFGGAMRYLYGVLHEMFPAALIFFITPCGLTYMSGSDHPYLKKGEQIKYAASLLGIPVIDWGANGRLSVCDNVITGSGTADDPYIYDAAGEYSVDSLHPNQNGSHFLAMEVAKILKAYNLVGYKK